MKRYITKIKNRLVLPVAFLLCLIMLEKSMMAQDLPDKEEPAAAVKVKPVKNTFQSVWIGDNQTVMVPTKKTLEMDIMHRFGTWNKGYEDFFGFFAPSNIRIGISYAPLNKLNVGVGFTKTGAAVIPYSGNSNVAGPIWDGSLKYSIITQTKNKYPVSASYYVNAAYNTKKDPNNEVYRYASDRISYFHQLLIARKVTEKLSLQVAPSISHINAVNGYFTKLNDSTLKVNKSMKFDHFAVAFSARYKLTEVTSAMVNYDLPITRHDTNNPEPSLSVGVEFNTSSHSFQLFFTNYYYILPQTNNLFNNNAPFSYQPTYHNAGSLETPATPDKIKGGRFLIGFNITRLWNY